MVCTMVARALTSANCPRKHRSWADKSWGNMRILCGSKTFECSRG